MVNTEDGDNELQNEQRGECGCCLGQFSDSHHLSVLSRKSRFLLDTILDPGKVIFGHFIEFGHFAIEIPIEAEIFLGRAFQLS